MKAASWGAGVEGGKRPWGLRDLPTFRCWRARPDQPSGQGIACKDVAAGQEIRLGAKALILESQNALCSVSQQLQATAGGAGATCRPQQRREGLGVCDTMSAQASGGAGPSRTAAASGNTSVPRVGTSHQRAPAASAVGAVNLVPCW